MDIRKTFIVNQPIDDKVWDVLGNDFGGAHKWATGIYHSEAYGKPQLAEASCNNRSCDITQGLIKEVVRVFDPKKHHLAYAVIESFPGFVKDNGDGSSTAGYEFNFRTKPAFMGGMVVGSFKGSLNETLIGLDHYLQTREHVTGGSDNAKRILKAYKADGR